MESRGRSRVRVAAAIAAVLVLTLVSMPATDTDPRQRREVVDLIGAARASGTAPQGTSVPLAPHAFASLFAPPITDGVGWLETNQNADGSWGSILEMIVTSTAVESLSAIDSGTMAVENGALWLEDQVVANHDFLARQAIALAEVPGFEDDALTLAVELLAVRNPEEFDPGLPNWPEGGWGLAPGFETDCLTTALALLALDRAGLNGGFALTDEPVAGGATNVHQWEIPSDATKVRILITVTGSEIRLCMTEGAPPPFCGAFFPLLGGPFLIVFPDSGLAFTPGTNFISIESPDPPATPATYTMTASYETPVLDTRSLAEPLAYLRESQNVDGGWGLQRGEATDFYTTLHVLLALLRYAPYEFDAEIADAVAYVESEQLVDGSFGFTGTGVPYVTALAALNLIRAGTCPYSTVVDDAIAALLAVQGVDGSWDQEAYDTALAVLALREYDTDGDGVNNCLDACPADDPDDTDGDGVCDSDDPCPADNPDDSDGDGVCNSQDICPGGDDTVDTDGDGTPDFCDGCAVDPAKTTPGVCGCGTADNDFDGDGVEDCNDPCPLDNPDDTDGDGVCDIEDICAGGNDAIDADIDGTPDACDNCPVLSNPGQENDDGDSAGNVCDCAPADPGATGPPEVGDISAVVPVAGTVRLSWAAVGGADFYAVTRGLISALATNQYGSCLAPNVGSTMLDDADLPPLGDAFGYLGQSGGLLCGLGTLGQDSAPAERVNLDPGTCP